MRADHPSLAAVAAAPSASAATATAPKRDELADSAKAIRRNAVRRSFTKRCRTSGSRWQWVVDFYHRTLKRSEEGRAYLAKGAALTTPKSLSASSWATPTGRLATSCRTAASKRAKTRRGQLQRLGVLRKSGHEHLSGSLVIPLLDEYGKVVQLYGRKVRDDLRKGTPRSTCTCLARSAASSTERPVREQQPRHCVRIAHRCAHLLVRGAAAAT